MASKTENFKNNSHPPLHSKRKKQAKAAAASPNSNLESRLVKVLSRLSKFGHTYSKNARHYTKENAAKGLIIAATMGFIAKRFLSLFIIENKQKPY